MIWGTLASLLTGCESIEQFYATKLPVDTPIEWWHDLQGGTIAEERPPPPGVGDPYPNLADIPARPTPTDAATRRSLSARLASERNAIQQDAAQSPLTEAAIPNVARPPAPPVPMAPIDTPPAAARIDAATAAPAPPRAAPTAPAPPAPAPLQAAAAAEPPPRRPAPGGQFVAGPVPALPTAVPPVPDLPGVPALAAAAPVPRARPGVDVAFLPASAVLRPGSAEALRTLATRRTGGGIAVLGGGDAASATPEAQAAALPLAWRRARAIADVLAAAGTPVSAMRIDAAALGRGGIVRLVE